MGLIYKPFGIVLGIVAALLGKRVFNFAWEKIDDQDPPPSARNHWFAGRTPWFPIHDGDHTAVTRHPERTMLLVWPTRDECWAADAIELFHNVGGQCLAYVGEGPGGRAGDDRFHALLGAFGFCVACAYGVADAACVCGVPQLWQSITSTALPTWNGFHDRLEIYAPHKSRPRRGLSRRRRRDRAE